MAKNSKRKGNAFERLIGKQILEAAGSSYSKVDCFRTPQSGGHAQYSQKSDLTTSKRLQRIFPFVPEGKHRRHFRLEHVFTMTKDFASYLDQAQASCKHEGNARNPLVVIRGHGGLIYAAGRAGDLRRYDASLTVTVPHLLFLHRGTPWVLVRFSDLLHALSARAKGEAKRHGGGQNGSAATQCAQHACA